MDHSKTLREQGIDETETVLLRRKYFFSDGNVDSRDPVQLNLLFVQARDSILNGTHPVTLDQACAFAGMQCQAQFGDYVETKHKPGFLEWVPFLSFFFAFSHSPVSRSRLLMQSSLPNEKSDCCRLYS